MSATGGGAGPDTPLVSIVINNCNYGRFLRTAIDSALAQTHPRVEVVVVDDGSTDDSRAIIRSYGDRVKAVFKSNGGQVSACNQGFSACHGELVLFLDSDDWYYSHAVARVVGAARGGAALIQFRLEIVDLTGSRIGQMPPPQVRFESGNVVPLLVSKGHFVGTVTSGNAFRRDALETILPAPEEAFQRPIDGYLLSTVPFLGEVAAIDDCLGAYRLHGGNEHELRSGEGVDLEQVRKRLGWTEGELALVERQAAARDIPVSGRLAMRHLGHVQLRLFSCRLEPDKHPHPDDVAWKLAFWGILRAVSETNRRKWRRAGLVAWFALFGLMPRPAARRLIAFLGRRGGRAFRAMLPR